MWFGVFEFYADYTQRKIQEDHDYLIERLIKHQLRSVSFPLTVHKVGATDENETC
jgi:hypothetical protein